MRFVKNLIATAALATVAAGLPAANNNNHLLDTLGKESTVVPGASTTASIPVHSSPGAIITTGSNLPSAPLSRLQESIIISGASTTPSVTVRTTPGAVITTGSNLPIAPISRLQEGVIIPSGGAIPVYEGADGHVTLTGMPPRRGVDGELMHVVVTVTVTESASSPVVPTDPVSVTGAAVDAAQVTYAPKPPTGPGGGHPDVAVEGRQMLPISSLLSLGERQMLPMPTTSSSVLSARTAPGTPYGHQPNVDVDWVPEHTTIDVATTIVSTTCAHKSCTTFTLTSTDAVTRSPSTFIGGLPTPTVVDYTTTWSPNLPVDTARDQEEVSITHTASYTITLSESIPIPTTLDPTWFPLPSTTGGSASDEPFNAPAPVPTLLTEKEDKVV
ncbi:hypothetical protein DHEL01_v207618 [Diaporthe helianthi]|uniref:Uncharacterized protein n=1 Tax=Diaporthe helianthi TaxID=158607 RepID=A0A2P5HUS8_DIAHE|nr:hypothetical protein DHEL01_v207618 [Diaporthe helianthi]